MSDFSSQLFDKEQLFKLSWRRLVYLLIALIALGATEYSTQVYRAHIYRNDIFDFGLADTAGNLFGVIVLIHVALFLSHADGPRTRFWIGTQTMGMIVYEFAQPLFPWGTFDPKDILATLIGCGIAFLLNLGLHGKMLLRRVEGDTLPRAEA